MYVQKMPEPHKAGQRHSIYRVFSLSVTGQTVRKPASVGGWRKGDKEPSPSCFSVTDRFQESHFCSVLFCQHAPEVGDHPGGNVRGLVEAAPDLPDVSFLHCLKL